jgi:uncharacterized membrane protein YhaH (DUF805 family)
MTPIEKAVIAGREAFERERANRGGFKTVWLAVCAVVAAFRLFEAYQHNSFSEALVTILFWLIVLPLLGIWWSKRAEHNSTKQK